MMESQYFRIYIMVYLIDNFKNMNYLMQKLKHCMSGQAIFGKQEYFEKGPHI